MEEPAHTEDTFPIVQVIEEQEMEDQVNNDRELVRKSAPFSFDETPIIGGVENNSNTNSMLKPQEISPESEFLLTDVNKVKCNHCQRYFNETVA